MSMITRTNNQLAAFSLGAASIGALAGALLATVLMLVGFVINNYDFVYAGTAVLVFVLPLAVGLRRGKAFDPLEPINLVALAFLYGTSLRAIWLLTSSSSRVDFIMMGTTLERVSANAPLMILSVVALIIGYVVIPYRIPIERIDFVRAYVPGKRRIWIAAGITGLVSLIGIPWMISEFGISFSGGLFSASAKQLAQYVNEEGELVYGAGYQRWLASAASHGFVLISAAVLAGIIRFRPSTVVAIAILFAMAAVTPFLTSSRTSLILLFLSLAIFAFYYGRLTLTAIGAVAFIAIPVFVGMGELRELNQQGRQSADIGALDRVLGSGNSIDLVRTSAIIDRVPETYPYQYGLTYAAIVGTVVPRALWVDKPQVGLGGIVKRDIFGQDTRNGGWPSGLIAEGWINFGIFGLILPLFIWGAMLRIMYETVRPLLGVSFPVTLLYAISVWRIGFDGIGLNFAHTVSQVFAFCVPLALLLFITKLPRRQIRFVPKATAVGG